VDGVSSLSTVVVLHEEAALEVRQVMALCPDHLALLHAGIRWAAIDEVVGTSRVLPSEACTLLDPERTSVPLPAPAAPWGARGGVAPLAGCSRGERTFLIDDGRSV